MKDLTGFTLTEKQQEAINICLDHFTNRKRTVIAGYAGTGKSTLVRFLIDKLVKENIIKEADIIFSAFTGKAAQVLTNKGCPALTLHKLLYEPRIDDFGEIEFVLKTDMPYELIVIDECSMVPMSMLQDLEEFGIPLIFLGDPGQLPPVQRDEDNHLLDHPDIFLTEVLRQALDSPIIQLSMKIRNGERIDNFNYPEAKVITKRELTADDLQNADMILVGTNAARKRVNKAMRAFFKKTGDIDKNEKLICTQNYWEDFIDLSLTNGTVGFLENWSISEKSYFKGRVKVPTFYGEFVSETGLRKRVHIDTKFLIEEESSLTFQQELKIKPRYMQPLKFTYAYAITGHKAQGSEWDNVIVFEEDFPYGEDHSRWLYTCVTRARKKVIIVKGGI